MNDEVSPEEQISPEAMKIALLREMQKHMSSMNIDIQSAQAELNIIRRNQESKGEVYPEKNISVTDKTKEIDPGVGMWRSVSVYNSGSSDCDVQINSESDLLTKPISLPSKVSKDFSFSTEVISKLFAKCASGESTTLEVEFKR